MRPQHPPSPCSTQKSLMQLLGTAVSCCPSSPGSARPPSPVTLRTWQEKRMFMYLSLRFSSLATGVKEPELWGLSGFWKSRERLRTLLGLKEEGLAVARLGHGSLPLLCFGKPNLDTSKCFKERWSKGKQSNLPRENFFVLVQPLLFSVLSSILVPQ